MDITPFVAELLGALTAVEGIGEVTIRTEGPIVRGKATLPDEMFLAIYYNQKSGTQAFALIQSGDRLWGIDYDNARGWHQHPLGSPEGHAATEPQSISEIIQQLKRAIALTSKK